MTFAFVAFFLALSATLFGLRQVRALRRTHGPGCVERDEGHAWAGRLLTWGVAMSIAGIALVPGASDPQAIAALLALDIPLIAGVVVLRRRERWLPHELLPAAAASDVSPGSSPRYSP